VATLLAGADSCRDGWIVVQEDIDAASITWRVFPDLQSILEQPSPPALLTLDIPIGLPDQGPRACDLAARVLLRRGRASSVFPAPIRPVLAATSHQEASAIRSATEGKRLSIQSWAIIPKIRAVDDYLRGEPSVRSRVREVHPEVCFYCLAGGQPMASAKKTAAGREERMVLLSEAFGNPVERAMSGLRELGCAADDLLDAFVALWTARRIHAGQAVTLPATPPRDSCGLSMEMVA